MFVFEGCDFNHSIETEVFTSKLLFNLFKLCVANLKTFNYDYFIKKSKWVPKFLADSHSICILLKVIVCSLEFLEATNLKRYYKICRRAQTEKTVNCTSFWYYSTLLIITLPFYSERFQWNARQSRFVYFKGHVYVARHE